jgi:[ribosomal protein S5]-alanine N-acetyltransferase
MSVPPPTIQSERLDLISLLPSFLEASLAGEHGTATQRLGVIVPPEWWCETALMHRRLDQLRADPTLQPWLLRAIVLRRTQEMVGCIGFHTEPDPDYLRELAPGGVELGYKIFAPFRRQGYATEACAALMAWACQNHHVTRFVVSISPNNLPSLRIAQHFGFQKVGMHIDEVDGLEEIFVREVRERER